MKPLEINNELAWPMKQHLAHTYYGRDYVFMVGSKSCNPGFMGSALKQSNNVSCFITEIDHIM